MLCYESSTETQSNEANLDYHNPLKSGRKMIQKMTLLRPFLSRCWYYNPDRYRYIEVLSYIIMHTAAEIRSRNDK